MRHPVPEGVRWMWKYCAIPNCECEHTKACNNSKCKCGRPKVCPARDCNCGHPKVCPDPKCNCSYPKLATSENCDGAIFSDSTDSTLVAIAKAINMDDPRKWTRISSSQRKQICAQLNRQFAGRSITLCGRSHGECLDTLFVQFYSGAVWFTIGFVTFPNYYRSTRDLRAEFPKGSGVKLQVTFKKIEFTSEDDQNWGVQLRCDSY